MTDKEKKEVEQFKDTMIYMTMKSDLKLAKADAASYKQMYEDTEDQLSRLKSDVKRHLDDGTAKKIPIDSDEWDLAMLQKKYDLAQDKIKMQEQEIARLRDQLNHILYEFHPEDMPQDAARKPQKAPVGRPTVGTPAEYVEARKMRKKGYSVAEIAEYMGWSVGFTQKKTKSVKVDPELKKKHMAERRKIAKKRK